MTEQYKDSYQNKYREEMAQIHAPLSLIEKTKAAVREEEKRLAAAAPGREAWAESANREKQTRAFSVRKWVYPLTAAAAILILASVSLSMRGMKSANMTGAQSAVYDGAAENGAVYEESAADAGYSETAMEAPAADTGAPMMEEASDEAFAEDEGAAKTFRTAEAPAEDGETARSEEQKAAGAADTMTQNASSGAEESEAEREDATQEKKEAIEDSLADLAADKGIITMEKVEKKPAFCSLPDTKTRVYEEKTFLVRKEQTGWVGYVETEDGEGYLFRGEMEDQKEFLQAMSELLAEINSVQNP